MNRWRFLIILAALSAAMLPHSAVSQYAQQPQQPHPYQPAVPAASTNYYGGGGWGGSGGGTVAGNAMNGMANVISAQGSATCPTRRRPSIGPRPATTKSRTTCSTPTLILPCGSQHRRRLHAGRGPRRSNWRVSPGTARPIRWPPTKWTRSPAASIGPTPAARQLRAATAGGRPGVRPAVQVRRARLLQSNADPCAIKDMFHQLKPRSTRFRSRIT